MTAAPTAKPRATAPKAPLPECDEEILPELPSAATPSPEASTVPSETPSTDARARAAARKRRLHGDLGYCMTDGALFSVMVGCGETYLPAFILAVGTTGVAAGLISTLPMLFGGVLQLLSPRAVRWVGSHRRWVVICSALQALSFLPLIAGGLLGGMPVVLAFLTASIYWGASLGTGPAWNTWITRIIPHGVRMRFFGCRSRWCQACVMVGFVAGGLTLHLGKEGGWALLAFAAIFAVAMLCRAGSAYSLWNQTEPAEPPPPQKRVSMLDLLSRWRTTEDGRLLVFLLAIQVGIQIAGPYFTPYMLRELGMSIGAYVVLIATSFVAKAASAPFFGLLAKRWGPQRLLWMGAVGVAPVSGLWLVSA
ncbi:MAG: hypothetical protein ACRDD1_08590, partial [Planctomycetia bacterium]